jgi:hypothetical protein
MRCNAIIETAYIFELDVGCGGERRTDRMEDRRVFGMLAQDDGNNRQSLAIRFR